MNGARRRAAWIAGVGLFWGAASVQLAAGPSAGSGQFTGGGGSSASPRFAVTGTIGQPVATTTASVGGRFSSRAGFWVQSTPWLNTLPMLAGATNATIDELAGHTQNLMPQDADLPAQVLTVGLVEGPAGLAVTNGVLAWTPSEVQGPSTNVVRVSVSDGLGSVTQSLTLVVREVNTLPDLAGATNVTIRELMGHVQNLAPQDADIPAQSLAVSLLQGPAGLVVTNGVLAWTPTPAQRPSTNLIRVSVTDGVGLVTRQFSLVVLDSIARELVLTAPAMDVDRFRFEIGGTAGVRAHIQSSRDLENWETVSTHTVPGVVEVPAAASEGFFRAVVVP